MSKGKSVLQVQQDRKQTCENDLQKTWFTVLSFKDPKNSSDFVTPCKQNMNQYGNLFIFYYSGQFLKTLDKKAIFKKHSDQCSLWSLAIRFTITAYTD